MNPERLLQHFERLSEAPNAIPRLRCFILDLAVRGKLVEQDHKDEPASDLLKRIQTEKARLAKEGRTRKEKTGTLLTANDLPFPIPEGWRWSQLAEIGLISPRNDTDGTTLASFVPMTLIPAEYGIPHKHEVRPWSEFKTGYTHFAEGDVGLAKITPCFENGKSTVFRGLTGGFGAGTTELHIVRPLLINADYVLVFLKCPHFIESGIPRMTGTAGQKRVPADYYAYAPFPLPPLAEQHRIVAKVDELMALCDQLAAAKNEKERSRDWLVAASLQRLNQPADDEAFREHARFIFNHLPRLITRPVHIKQLRQTILSLAVRGKLVSQNPHDEPATELLKRILAEKARLVKEGKIRKQNPQAAIALDELPFALPNLWVWARLGDVIHLISGQHLQPGEYSNQSPSGLPYITGPADFGEDGLVITRYAVVRKAVAKHGQVLLTVKGAGVGKTAICDLPEVAISRQLMAMTAIAWSQDFLLLMTHRLAETLKESARSLIPGISREDVDQFVFALPPLAEQHRIVAKINELMARCDQLEAQLTTTATDSRRLLDAVLHEALTPALEEAA